MNNNISRRAFARGAALTGVGASLAGCTATPKVSKPVMRMTKADLEFLTSKRAGLMGSSGTGTGTSDCDNTSVHCCFQDVVRVNKIGDGKFELNVAGVPFPIDAVDSDDEIKR